MPKHASGPQAMLAWRIVNASAEREAEIDLYDVIGDDWMGTTAKQFIDELRDLDVDRIHLNINSPGGYVDDALAIYSALQRHPAEVVAHIVVAQSAASFVAQAADKRLLAKNGRIFIHDAQGIALGSAEEMRAKAAILDEESDNIASIYAERAGGTVTEWRDRMRADGFGTNYRGQEAVDVGLADEIEAVPARNAQPDRIAALADDDIDIPLELIPPLANGYRPPLPDDFTRLVAANMPARKEA